MVTWFCKKSWTRHWKLNDRTSCVDLEADRWINQCPDATRTAQARKQHAASSWKSHRRHAQSSQAARLGDSSPGRVQIKKIPLVNCFVTISNWKGRTEHQNCKIKWKRKCWKKQILLQWNPYISQFSLLHVIKTCSVTANIKVKIQTETIYSCTQNQ